MSCSLRLVLAWNVSLSTKIQIIINKNCYLSKKCSNTHASHFILWSCLPGSDRYIIPLTQFSCAHSLVSLQDSKGIKKEISNLPTNPETDTHIRQQRLMKVLLEICRMSWQIRKSTDDKLYDAVMDPNRLEKKIQSGLKLSIEPRQTLS